MATLTKLDNNEQENYFDSCDNIYNNILLDMTSTATKQVKTNAFSNSAILARSKAPESHRRAADSFMIIRKVFGHPVINYIISEEEKDFLAKYAFTQLKYTTFNQIKEELALLRRWSYTEEKELNEASDRIINVRVKELKKPGCKEM